MINMIFGAWVLFSAYRGYRSGWLSMLLGLLAFFLAYLACFLGTEALAGVFRVKGMNALYAILLAAILLFSGTGFLVSVVPRWIFSRFGWTSGAKRSIAGAGLGLVSGLISALFMLWALSLLRVVFALPLETAEIEKQARRVIGSVAELGVDASGAEGVKARATKALFKDPQAFTQSLKALTESDTLKEFVNDRDTQALMGMQDIDGLLENPKFIALAEHKGMQVLMSDQKRPNEFEIRELAENLTQVWLRMQVLKRDPEIQTILKDEEIQTLIKQQNPVTLLSNKKIQIIIDRVVETDLSDIEYLKPLISEPEKKATEKKAAPIYQWLDDNNSIKFSDYQSIPLDKRDQAIQVGGGVNE